MPLGIGILILLAEALLGGLLGHHLAGKSGMIVGAIFGALLGALIWYLVRKLQNFKWQPVSLEKTENKEAQNPKAKREASK